MVLLERMPHLGEDGTRFARSFTDQPLLSGERWEVEAVALAPVAEDARADGPGPKGTSNPKTPSEEGPGGGRAIPRVLKL